MPRTVFSPRVAGTARPDFHSIETFLASPLFAGKTDEALALAIYNYFTSTVDGTYHFWPQEETEGEPRVRGRVEDPVVLLNAYGWAICGQTAGVLYNLYTAAGLQARVFGAPGHTLCEVFYDNRWHVLDVDMWTWFRAPEGHIASAVELIRNPDSLILKNKNKSNPCNLPDRTLEGYAGMYGSAETVGDEIRCIFPPWNTRGHTMDFHLRSGETLIRSQGNTGRFHFPRAWLSHLKTYPSEWAGFPRERYKPFRAFGNGRWNYAPQLGSGFRDFETGVWERSGLTQQPDGLSGPGSAVFRIQSPYPFCGKPDWHNGERVTYSDGVWIQLAGEGNITAEIQDSEGKWISIASSTGKTDTRIDVTALFEARYSALVRITLGEKSKLRRFEFDGFVMTAPLSLPRLSEGENRMEIRGRDAYGEATVPWTILADFRESADPAAACFRADNLETKPHGAKGWKILAPKNSSKPLTAVYRYRSPAGRKFSWFYALATVLEGPQNQPLRKASLDMSADGRRWTPLEKIDITNGRNQWDNSLAAQTRLDVPAEEIYLRVASETPLAAMNFYGHLDEKSRDAGTLEITHRWKEDDNEKSFAAPSEATSYVIRCGKNPREHTIEMKVPSSRQ